MATRWIPRACGAVFVCGIAGLIISSIAGNNNGVVLTIGGCIAAAALVLLTYSAIMPKGRIEAFSDADAERFEARINELVALGADEGTVRALVRDALRVGRR